jgi:hypothetical protein
MIDENELAYPELREPRAQLHADRSTGTGDEDGRVGQILAERTSAHVDDRPTEHRLDSNILAAYATALTSGVKTVGRNPRRLLSLGLVVDAR